MTAMGQLAPMSGPGRVRVPMWLKSRPYSRLLATGSNVKSRASNLNFCRPAYAAIRVPIFLQTSRSLLHPSLRASSLAVMDPLPIRAPDVAKHAHLPGYPLFRFRRLNVGEDGRAHGADANPNRVGSADRQRLHRETRKHYAHH